MPKFWFHLGDIIHSSISFAKINHLHLNYCVIYTKGGDYCKVSTSQNKANPWSIKSSHYSITYTSTNVKVPQENKKLLF